MGHRDSSSRGLDSGAHVMPSPGSCTRCDELEAELILCQQQIVRLTQQLQLSSASTDTDTGAASWLYAAAEQAQLAARKERLQFDPHTNLFYDTSTGMYQDADTNLWYEPSSQVYYRATASPEGNQQLQYHSSYVTATAQVAQGPSRCLRLVVHMSQSLPFGHVYVIDVGGCSVGRNGIFLLADPEISKLHLEIIYDPTKVARPEKHAFLVRDLGSVNGTFLNGQRLSEREEPSDLQDLQHLDVLQLGSRTLLAVHIHPSDRTCRACQFPNTSKEASQAVAVASVTATAQPSTDLQAQRAQELNRLKRKYQEPKSRPPKKQKEG